MRLTKTLIIAPKKGKELEKKHKTQQKDGQKFESLISVMKNATNFSAIHKKLASSKLPAKIHEHKNLAKDSVNHLKSAKSKKNSNLGNKENDRTTKFFLSSSKIISSKHSKESKNSLNLSHSKLISFDVHTPNSKDKGHPELDSGSLNLKQTQEQSQKIGDLPDEGNALKQHSKESKKSSKEHSESSSPTHVFRPRTQNARAQFDLKNEKDSSFRDIPLKHLKESKNPLKSFRFNHILSDIHVPHNQNQSISIHQNDKKKSDKNTTTVSFRLRNAEIQEQKGELKINYLPSQKKVKSSQSSYREKEFAEESTLSSKNDEHKSVSLKESLKSKEKNFKFSHFQKSKKKENELKKAVKIPTQEYITKTSQNLSHFQKKVTFSVPKSSQINQNDVHEIQKEKNAVLVNVDKFISNKNKKDKLKLVKVFEDDIRIKIEKGNFSPKKDETRFSRIINRTVHINPKKRELEPYKVLPQVSREFTSLSQVKVLLKEKKIEGHEILNHIVHEVSQAVVKALENQKPPLKLEIKLNPPQLGKVSITVIEKAGKTFLTLNAENQRTQELLKMVAPIIINQLSNLNFNIVDVQLNAQQWLENGGERHSRNNNGGREKQKDDGKFSDDFKETYEKEV